MSEYNPNNTYPFQKIYISVSYHYFNTLSKYSNLNDSKCF